VGRVRYQFDEHIAIAVAAGLRRVYIDVVTAAEVGLLGVPDTTVLAHAHAASWVIVTSDTDYLRLNAAGVPHSGIVFCPKDTLPIGEMIEFLVLIFEAMSSEELIGHVEYI
jgi:hypothetical protein